MRLKILNNGYSFGTKMLFSLIRIFSGQALPDAAKIVLYRPDFYGSIKFIHEALRGPSEWSVAAVLTNLETAPIGKPLKETLRMLGKLTTENNVTVEDIRTVLAAGVSRKQIEDALAVCFAFNLTYRLANAFDFEIVTPQSFEAGAKYLLKRGYR